MLMKQNLQGCIKRVMSAQNLMQGGIQSTYLLAQKFPKGYIVM